MRNMMLSLCCAALAAFGTGCDEQTGDRTVNALNGGGWKFAKDATCQLDASAITFDDALWPCVEVPHDWAISGPFQRNVGGGSGKLPWRGVGWYRRTFRLSEQEKKELRAGGAAWLEFDGVMAGPRVFVNGCLAGGWDYGYMGFRVDATPFLKEGENILAVRADTRDHHSRWYPGAGIYRAVRLVVAPAVHVVPATLFVTTPEISKERAVVNVAFTVTNRLGYAVRPLVGARIRNGSGGEVAKAAATVTEIPPYGCQDYALAVPVADPALWDVTSPNLYTAAVGVKTEGALDAETVRFGIRTIAFPADDGFHLNGRRVQINGVDLHSDMGVLGMAFNRSVMRRQLAIMKDMGVNALRTSHNAPDPQVLDLCDEMGIVVWNECFDKWDGTAGRRSEQNLEEYVSRNLRAFARRDRNHPSVIIWSISNEIPPVHNGKKTDPNGMTRERCRLFREAVRTCDTTRPVGNGNCFGNAVSQDIFADLDITGWNYGGQYANIKRHHPNKPVLYSESASAVSSYGFYSEPPPASKATYATNEMEVCSYDHNAAPWSDIPDKEFERMERDRYCGGEFVWTGIDYLGEPTPYNRYCIPWLTDDLESRSSYFGIVDLAGIPKDRFYLYRSHWNKKEETIHLLPHWNWAGREGKKTPVYVYTSGDSAELFLNGRSLGRRTKGVVQRPVNLAEGKTASASSYEKHSGVENPASAAVDAVHETRWCAKGPIVGSWWQVDLGAETAFTTLLISAEQADVNYAWTVSLSDDGKTWREYRRKVLGANDRILPKKARARYVRVTFSQMKEGTWPSIREFIASSESDLSRMNPYYDVCDKYRLRWFDVPYEPGELKAVAYRNGAPIGETVMRTAGKAAAVKLTPEEKTLPADGTTYVFVQVDVVDAKGVRDPWARNRIRFALSGPGKIMAVGNGDPRGRDAFTDVSSHALYFGKAVVVVRREAGKTGPIRLTAEADGLRRAEIEW